jgi:hypothetical protein
VTLRLASLILFSFSHTLVVDKHGDTEGFQSAT